MTPPIASAPDAVMVTSEGRDRELMLAVEEFLDRHPPREQDRAAKLVSPDGGEVDVPPQVFDILRQITALLAQGSGVAVSAVSRELTTTQAAKALSMSRPTLVKLAESGQLASHRVGTHRRFRLQDVLDYRRRQMAERRLSYEALMLEADALGVNGN